MLDFQCLHELDNHIEGIKSRIKDKQTIILQNEAALDELIKTKLKLESMADRWREKIEKKDI